MSTSSVVYVTANSVQLLNLSEMFWFQYFPGVFFMLIGCSNCILKPNDSNLTEFISQDHY